MLTDKVKLFIEHISSIRFLGIRDFVIVDIHENSANVVLFHTGYNSFKLFSNSPSTQHKILSQRECEISENNNFELNREIKILSDKHKPKNALLLLLINKYKYFNISLSKEAQESDEETSIEDLIKKQLPPTLNDNDFILHLKKISEDELFDNYLVTVTRKRDIEKYLDVINNEIFQLRFALPSIFILAKQRQGEDKICTLIDFQKEKLIHYQLTNENKFTEDEYFIEQESINSDIKYENSVVEKLEKIISSFKPFSEDIQEKGAKVYFHTKLELTSALSKAMLKINSERESKISYENSTAFKHTLAYSSLFIDTIFNFNLEKHFTIKPILDIERTITTRFLVGIFLALLFLLMFLNGMNWITNSSLSDISLQSQNRRGLELQLKDGNVRIEQLKSDIKSLNKIKYKTEKISKFLKILSMSTIDNLFLTDLTLKKNNTGKYEIKLSGESYSKDEVITYIKNLESNPELSNVELIWMDKKKEGAYNVQNSNNSFRFSINLIYNENKNS